MYLVIDNYDSFTFNLVHLLGRLGVTCEVVRNDEIVLEDIDRLGPEAIVLSPGPCTPAEAGITGGAVARFLGRAPILGVCLGHQAIACQLGGRVVPAQAPIHGKAVAVSHEGTDLFESLPSPFQATCYNSLVVDEPTLPSELMVTARNEVGEILALTHRTALCVGLQFHPESVLTVEGPRLLGAFTRRVEAFWSRAAS